MFLLVLQKVTRRKIIAFRLRPILHPNMNPNLTVRLIANGIYLLLSGIDDPVPRLSEFAMRKRENTLMVGVPTDRRGDFALFVFGKASGKLVPCCRWAAYEKCNAQYRSDETRCENPTLDGGEYQITSRTASCLVGELCGLSSIPHSSEPTVSTLTSMCRNANTQRRPAIAHRRRAGKSTATRPGRANEGKVVERRSSCLPLRG